MATEIELKLQVTAQAARQLSHHPLLAAWPCRRDTLLNTYYDTPELELTARRMALRFRKKGKDWLLTVKSAEPAQGGLAVRSEWECAATPGCFDFSHVDVPAVREFLESRVDRLQAIFTTDFRRQRWLVEQGSSKIEVALDRGHIDSQGRRTPICELELELLSGQIADLFAFTQTLQHDTVLRPAPKSKAERGYKLFLNAGDQPVSSTHPKVSAEQSPVAALRGIALACLEQFQRNENGLLDATQPEFIHQARVGLRRLRSALKLFAPILPGAFAADWSAAWKKLAARLGEVRNSDVFLHETLPDLRRAFPGQAALDRLEQHIRRQQKSERSRLRQHLRDGAHARQLVDFMAALFTLPEQNAPPLAKLARKALKKRSHKVEILAAQWSELSPEGRHGLRIEVKKLRYAVEFFSALLPQTELKPYLKNLSALQSALGELNDLITAKTIIQNAPHPAGGALLWLNEQHTRQLETLPKLLAQWQGSKPPLPQ